MQDTNIIIFLFKQPNVTVNLKYNKKDFIMITVMQRMLKQLSKKVQKNPFSIEIINFMFLLSNSIS